MEIWVDVKEANSNYEVSNLGRIRSKERRVINNINGGTRLIKSKIISQKTKSNGYKEVSLAIEPQVSKMFYVHRLVASGFIGKIDNLKVINHKDGVKSNNIVDNLEIVTYRDNSLHSCHVLGNTAPKMAGDSHACSKLTSDKVINIRKMYDSGIPSRDISESYKEVSLSTIRKVCYRSTWAHI
jgi:NUMOD4 motif/HNH endonuclease